VDLIGEAHGEAEAARFRLHDVADDAALPGDDQFIIERLRETDGARLNHRIGARHQQQVFLQQGRSLEIGAFGHVPREGHVDLPAINGVEQHHAALLHQTEGHARQLAPGLDQDVRPQQQHEAGRHAKHHMVDARRGEGLQLPLGGLHIGEDAPRALEQQLARFGGRHPARMAHEQIEPQLAFQLTDLHAKGGLGDVQLLGGGRHVAGFDHLDEI
jgi:hypothetical protein